MLANRRQGCLRSHMQRVENIPVAAWTRSRASGRTRVSARTFAAILIVSACVSAAFASWLPLQASIVTVFLFAGPHNWFEARYFLMRLPARFGRSRNFFLLAFAGIALLTLAYVSLPALYYAGFWSGANWPNAIATWNTLMLLWIGALVLVRGKQGAQRGWVLGMPPGFGVFRPNWLGPGVFCLGVGFVFPLGGALFFHRHFARRRT